MRERILNDLVSAMKAQNKELLAVLRMVKASIQMEEINVKHELSDDEVISVLSHQIKTRKESITEFMKANRQDLVEQTQREIDILKEYMPDELSYEELIKIIDDVFEKVKPSSIKQMGIVMKNVTPLVNGRADMSEVSRIIKERLNK